tara:strand:+ start:823 stop:1227 length:405 start_codon:yes stop_codon:yes gene_type:complete
MEPVINLITPPDKLYNGELSFLLVSPSDDKKEQFNQMAKKIGKDLNVYLFEKSESPDVPWLLDVSQQVDFIILDIDNISQEYQWLIGYFLSFNKTFYLTSAEQMSYNVINTRRIYDVGQIAEENNYFVKFQRQT